MSKGGGDQVTTQKQMTQPLDWQQPYISYGLRRAEQNLGQSNPDAYTQRVAEMLQNAPTYTGNLDPSKFYDLYDASNVGQHLGQLSTYASSDPLQDVGVQSIGTGNIGDAWNTLGDTARGSFLNSNPYVNAMFDQASGRVGEQFQNYTVPSTDAAFARAGRTGSGSYAMLRNDQDKTLGTSLGDLATNIYGGNYANERGLMQQAAGLLGQTGTSTINNAQANRLGAAQYLSDFGGNMANMAYNAELSRLGYGLDSMRTAGDPLSAYFDRVGSLYGSNMEGTATTPKPKSSIFGALGKAALGVGSLAVPGGGTLGGAFLSGLGATPALTAASFGAGGGYNPPLGFSPGGVSFDF